MRVLAPRASHTPLCWRAGAQVASVLETPWLSSRHCIVHPGRVKERSELLATVAAQAGGPVFCPAPQMLRYEAQAMAKPQNAQHYDVTPSGGPTSPWWPAQPVLPFLPNGTPLTAAHAMGLPPPGTQLHMPYDVYPFAPDARVCTHSFKDACLPHAYGPVPALSHADASRLCTHAFVPAFRLCAREGAACTCLYACLYTCMRTSMHMSAHEARCQGTAPRSSRSGVVQ